MNTIHFWAGFILGVGVTGIGAGFGIWLGQRHYKNTLDTLKKIIEEDYKK